MRAFLVADGGSRNLTVAGIAMRRAVVQLMAAMRTVTVGDLRAEQKDDPYGGGERRKLH